MAIANLCVRLVLVGLLNFDAVLAFIGPCIASIFSEYNQQGATFRNLFISIRRSACFRRVFRPSSASGICQTITA